MQAPRCGFHVYFTRVSEIRPLHERLGIQTVALAINLSNSETPTVATTTWVSVLALHRYVLRARHSAAPIQLPGPESESATMLSSDRHFTSLTVPATTRCPSWASSCC